MNRTGFLLLGTLVVFILMLAANVTASEKLPNPDVPIVLVHGAWGGAHDWRAVEKALNHLGYEVRRVSLTGQGERSHLISLANDFDTHVKDVVNMVEFEYWEDEKIYLVGHSYGGSVITGVASQIPHRLEGLIYVDAQMPTPDKMIGPDELKEKEGAITGFNFLRDPTWPVYWEDPSGPKDVPHQAKTSLMSKSAFPKYDAAIKLPGSAIILAGPDWDEHGPYPDNKQLMYNTAKERGYYIIGKSWGHNAHRDNTEEFVPVLLDAIANMSNL
ncbi:MAG: alpha/beta hydrolase [Firmicutes bacterium]|nr:alpha/beta hydrolase [Bacillota bacterium]